MSPEPSTGTWDDALQFIMYWDYHTMKGNAMVLGLPQDRAVYIDPQEQDYPQHSPASRSWLIDVCRPDEGEVMLEVSQQYDETVSRLRATTDGQIWSFVESVRIVDSDEVLG